MNWLGHVWGITTFVHLVELRIFFSSSRRRTCDGLNEMLRRAAEAGAVLAYIDSDLITV